MPRPLVIRDLGRLRYGDALVVQQHIVEERKRGEGMDHLLFVEHPHVVTLGRNAREENVLASDEVLARTGIERAETNRGGDVTYHGPGQLVGYPVLDLRDWRRDVVAYVRGLEQVLIDALAEFGLPAGRSAGHTGVWVGGAKVAAIGVHISRWVTSHGFALNVDTDLRYFQYIVPCGLTLPVTSLRALGSDAPRSAVRDEVSRRFADFFGFERPAAARTLETANGERLHAS